MIALVAVFNGEERFKREVPSIILLKAFMLEDAALGETMKSSLPNDSIFGKNYLVFFFRSLFWHYLDRFKLKIEDKTN